LCIQKKREDLWNLQETCHLDFKKWGKRAKFKCKLTKVHDLINDYYRFFVVFIKLCQTMEGAQS
jgi:hypothetical protein